MAKPRAKAGGLAKARPAARPAKPARAKPAKATPAKATPAKAKPARAKPAANQGKVRNQATRARATPKSLDDALARIGLAVYAENIDLAVELAAAGFVLATTRKQRRELQGTLRQHALREQWGQRWEAAARLFDAGVAGHRKGDDTELTGQLLGDAGFAKLQLHRLEDADADLRRALALHEEAKREVECGNVLDYLSNVSFERGRIAEAVELARAAVARAKQADDARGAAFHSYSLARALYEQGHSYEAEQLAKDHVETARALGVPAVEANLENMIANVAFDDHRLDEARRHYEHARALFRQVGLANHAAITTSNLGLVAWNEERLAEALALFDKAIKLHKKAKDARSTAIGLTARADVLIEQGKLAEAQRDLEAALATLTTRGHERRVSFVRVGFARLAEARGELAEARAHYAEAEISFEAAGDHVEIGRMLYAAAGVEAELGDPEAAEAQLARAAALDPASLAPDHSGIGERRAGMHGIRVLRELAIARIELARAARLAGDRAAALRQAATARLAAAASLLGRSAETRRVVARITAQLAAASPGATPAVRYAGTAAGTGWNATLAGELAVSREHGQVVATGRLSFSKRTARVELRGLDVGEGSRLTGRMTVVGEGAKAEWLLRFELAHAGKVLRGRLIEVLEEGGEDEICVLQWPLAPAIDVPG